MTQLLIYSTDTVIIENIPVTLDEAGLVKVLLNWLRTHDYSDFTISKHKNVVNWTVTLKDRNDNFIVNQV